MDGRGDQSCSSEDLSNARTGSVGELLSTARKLPSLLMDTTDPKRSPLDSPVMVAFLSNSITTGSSSSVGGVLVVVAACVGVMVGSGVACDPGFSSTSMTSMTSISIPVPVVVALLMIEACGGGESPLGSKT